MSRGQRKSSAPRTSDTVYLYGVHAVLAALANPKRNVLRLHATRNGSNRIGKQDRVAITICEPADLERLVGRDAVHQGVVLEAEPLEQLDESELFYLADKKLVVVLDQITDPHNVGAILRSASAFAADAVILTRRGGASESGVLAKAASGGLDHTPIVLVRNLAKALRELNEQRYLTLGLDSDGEADVATTLERARPSRVAIVLGAEGRGLREQTREACTVRARLNIPGAIRSLNVSNAAVLALHLAREAIARQSS